MYLVLCFNFITLLDINHRLIYGFTLTQQHLKSMLFLYIELCKRLNKAHV